MIVIEEDIKENGILRSFYTRTKPFYDSFFPSGMKFQNELFVQQRISGTLRQDMESPRMSILILVNGYWLFRAAEDPEFETFYTKKILLNEGIRAWMDQPHENLVFPEALPFSICQS
jgi:hypothetical protein